MQFGELLMVALEIILDFLLLAGFIRFMWNEKDIRWFLLVAIPAGALAAMLLLGKVLGA